MMQTKNTGRKTGWGQKIIDLRDYTPGTYLIRLSDSGKTLQSAKFVKH